MIMSISIQHNLILLESKWLALDGNNKRNFWKSKSGPKNASDVFQSAPRNSTLKLHFKAEETRFERKCFKEEVNATHARTFWYLCATLFWCFEVRSLCCVVVSLWLFWCPCSFGVTALGQSCAYCFHRRLPFLQKLWVFSKIWFATLEDDVQLDSMIVFDFSHFWPYMCRHRCYKVGNKSLCMIPSSPARTCQTSPGVATELEHQDFHEPCYVLNVAKAFHFLSCFVSYSPFGFTRRCPSGGKLAKESRGRQNTQFEQPSHVWSIAYVFNSHNWSSRDKCNRARLLEEALCLQTCSGRASSLAFQCPARSLPGPRPRSPSNRKNWTDTITYTMIFKKIEIESLKLFKK